jgi:subtilisin family serine protease
VISGSANGQGIRGFAPDAHVIACKIFPGGAFSSLISALDFCMDQAVDVINLSLGSSERSEIVEQRLLRAKQMGIACIVAAGNSGGPVQYPATSPNVLAVAAIGKQGEFPQDSYHTQTLSDGAQGDFFSAKFSCFGPEIAVCGPGVAVLSSVPPNNYAAWDGTSMAAPHITGLAALILAHHEDFKNRFRERNAARVDRLFEILRQSARPVGVNDRTRVGAGMPDAVRALGLEAAATTADASNDLLKRLLAALQQGGMVQPGIPAPVAMDQLRQRLAAAGILGNVPQAAAAATGAAGQQQFAAQSFGMPQYGNIGAQQPVDVRGALDRLRASMQDAQLIK